MHRLAMQCESQESQHTDFYSRMKEKFDLSHNSSNKKCGCWKGLPMRRLDILHRKSNVEICSIEFAITYLHRESKIKAHKGFISLVFSALKKG